MGYCWAGDDSYDKWMFWLWSVSAVCPVVVMMTPIQCDQGGTRHHQLLSFRYCSNFHEKDWTNLNTWWILGWSNFSKCSQIEPPFLYSMCMGDTRSHTKFQVSSLNILEWRPLFVNWSWPGVNLLCLCEGIHVARFAFFKKYEDWLWNEKRERKSWYFVSLNVCHSVKYLNPSQSYWFISLLLLHEITFHERYQ